MCELFVTKLIENEFVAYLKLEMIIHSESDNPLQCCWPAFALCGFANLSAW